MVPKLVEGCAALDSYNSPLDDVLERNKFPEPDFTITPDIIEAPELYEDFLDWGDWINNVQAPMLVGTAMSKWREQAQESPAELPLAGRTP